MLRLGDAFVTKLNPNGNQLLYSTYVGGGQDEMATAIAIDGAGNAYVTGSTLSRDFPTSAGVYQPAFKGTGGEAVLEHTGLPFFVGGDAFVFKLNPTGSQLLFSTYLGGTQDEIVGAIAIDSSSNVYVGGSTLSTDFPVTDNALQKKYQGKELQNNFFNFGDGFVATLNAAGTALLYSTYLGGSGDDEAAALAVDGEANI